MRLGRTIAWRTSPAARPTCSRLLLGVMGGLVVGGCGRPAARQDAGRLSRTELQLGGTNTVAVPTAILEAWRLSPAGIQSDRLSAARVGATRRHARLVKAPFTATADIPPAASELALWVSSPTAAAGVPDRCAVTIRAAWPDAEPVEIALPARLASQPGVWTELQLRRLPAGAFAVLSVSATPAHECAGTDVWQAVSEVQITSLEPSGDRPNVVFVVIDTLRRDAFDCSLEGASLAPNVAARWCPRGVFFADAISTSSWTYPAITSMLTGLRPREHGALRTNGVHTDLRADVATLPEILRWAGYETVGIVSNPYAARGLWRGFDSFLELFPGPGRMTWESRRAKHVIDAATTWLGQPHAAPFFMFLLLVDLHEPVDASARLGALPSECIGVTPLPAAWEGLGQPAAPPTADEERRMICRRALYREAWRYVDVQLGRLMAALAERGHDADTAVILASDHGEEFWDHAAAERPAPGETKARWGVDHGHTMYAELVRVPLLLVPPGRLPLPPARQSDALVSVADLFATTLGIAGVTAPMATTSLDLSPVLAGAPAPSHARVISESTLYGPDWLSVTDPRHRAVYIPPGRLELFNRLSDPADLTPLPLASPDAREAAQTFRATLKAPVLYSAPSESDLEVLRALGYVR